MNICDLISEIGRESEFVIYNNRMKKSNEYKKEYLERLIKIDELVFVKDNDFGYHAVPTIFNNIVKAVEYIVDFKPHKIQSPFMNNIECINICGYSSVLGNLKNNILKELTKDDFKQYAHNEAYLKLLTIVNKINFYKCSQN